MFKRLFSWSTHSKTCVSHGSLQGHRMETTPQEAPGPTNFNTTSNQTVHHDTACSLQVPNQILYSTPSRRIILANYTPTSIQTQILPNDWKPSVAPNPGVNYAHMTANTNGATNPLITNNVQQDETVCRQASQTPQVFDSYLKNLCSPQDEKTDSNIAAESNVAYKSGATSYSGFRHCIYTTPKAPEPLEAAPTAPPIIPRITPISQLPPPPPPLILTPTISSIELTTVNKENFKSKIRQIIVPQSLQDNDMKEPTIPVGYETTNTGAHTGNQKLNATKNKKKCLISARKKNGLLTIKKLVRSGKSIIEIQDRRNSTKKPRILRIDASQWEIAISNIK